MFRFLLIASILTLSLVGCGGSSSPTIGESTTSVAAGSTTAALPTTTSAEPATTITTATTTSEAITTSGGGDLLRIKIEDGVKTGGPDTISVRVGETVRFEVEADVADEVHVHGYDLTFEADAGAETLVEFVANATGIFEVELEGLRISIVDIEVTP